MCSSCCCCCASTGCCKNYSAMIAPRRVPSGDISGKRYCRDHLWQHHSIYREYWAQYNHLLEHFDRLVNPFSQPKLSCYLCGEEKPAKRSVVGYPVRKNALEQAARSRVVEQPTERNSHSSGKHSRHGKGKRPKKVHDDEVDEEKPSNYWKIRRDIEYMCKLEEREAAGPSQREIMQHIREWRQYEPEKKIHAWSVGDKEHMEELYGKENAMKVIELLNAEDKAFQNFQNKKKYMLWPAMPLKL